MRSTIDTSTNTLTSDAPSDPHAHVLIIDGASCRALRLPRNGVQLIGRSSSADIQIDAADVSRRHAKLILASGDVQVTDLGSHNGTLVNGERIQGTRPLSSGDVLTLGGAVLVLRCEARPSPLSALNPARLRRRLEEETDRAVSYARPLGVVVVSLGDAGDRAAAAQRGASALRLMDVLGSDGETQLVAVLPELGGEAARAAAEELLEGIARDAPGARGGLAVCPADGCDAETLLSGARVAAGIAAPGTVVLAAQAAVHHIIGSQTILLADTAMIRIFDLIRRLAASDLPVLVLGETGAGKENAAAAVHEWSPRAAKPFVTLNCAAIHETLLESELFGYEQGAFSDGRAAKPGLLERASGGTVLLDEIGDLAPSAQAKLLRALEAKQITRLGDVREREIDIRVVAGTNRDLAAECRAGRFREDLLFRLSAAVVELPPLRHRPREVPILSRHFVATACARAGRPALELSEAALYKLASYSWPGNVRELKNAVEFAVATAEGASIEPWDLPDRITGRAPSSARPEEPSAPPASSDRPAAPRRFRPIAEELRELERGRMLEALEETGGVQSRAAELISMPLRTFALKIKQYGISPREVKRRNA